MVRRIGVVLGSAAIAVACGRSPSELLLRDPGNPLIGDQSKCAVRHSRSNPLIVEWPAADRGSLEMRMRRGIAIVRYEGCHMQVLRRCTVPELSYRYGGFTRKAEQVRMRDADELYANLPVGAAKLEAKLETADALTVAMTMVGMYEAERDEVRLDELVGDCDGATHIVTGVQVGAYAFFVERAASIGGSAGLTQGVGIGANSHAARETLSVDGDVDRCAAASPDDAVPPHGCGALLRLEVVPLGRARVADVRCPDGMAWTGTQCRSVAIAPAMSCPPGFAWDDAKCRRSACDGDAATCEIADGDCPPGMALVPGGTLDEHTHDDVCLDRTEVTAWAYARCVDDDACTPAADTVWWPGIERAERDAASELCTAYRSDRQQHPINCVTWAQADAYCRWRGARLPDDREWKWAAIGGADRRAYPWGAAPVSAARVNACGSECRAWFQRRGLERRRVAYADDDGWAATAIVGSYPAGANRWGVLDLAGNVAEWTASWTDDHRRRRVRGGSFLEQRTAWLRNDDTIAARPDRRDATIGFRCATDP